MPQLIAMVIVVVGAMIYMFQTFGGTGDKIEGIAQKASVITEINNIKGDLIIGLRSGEINSTIDTLGELAALGYFSKQINAELKDNTAEETTEFKTGEINTYSAISFGGEENASMNISLIVGDPGTIPGIRVHLFNNLKDNAAFLESQITTDLKSTASIDRTTKTGTHVKLTNGKVPAVNRAKSENGTATTNLSDGIFTVYFKDMYTN